ncbi:MAG: sugar nucleotide-binding protein [Pseudomonadota bacterium]
MTTLVVGGDSLVGASVVRALRERAQKVVATTRREGTVSEDRILLDFERPETYQVGDSIESALIIAAATNYERCETDPMARTINVKLIPDLVLSLLDQGKFVSFISTNSVFGGNRPWPHEDDEHAPDIAYAQQKSDGEKAIRQRLVQGGTAERFSIIRLTKIMNSKVSPLPAWFAAWEAGQPIEPFEDLIFAPISVRFVGDALAELSQKRLSGNLHLSGADNVSYVRFAHALANELGIDPSLVKPTTSEAKGIHIAFKPKYSGIGMERTSELSGLAPQAVESLVKDIIADHFAATGES